MGAEGEGTAAADRFLLVASLVDLGLLLVTGTWLVVGYRPTTAAGLPIGAPNAFAVDWVRLVHRWSAHALVVLGVGWLVWASIRLVGAHVRLSRVFLAGATFVLAVGGWMSGWLLPWDQLAMWSVNVGDNLTGYRVLLDDRVRFVLIGSTEASVDQLRAVLLLHALVVPLGVLASVVLSLRARGPRVRSVNLDGESSP